MNRPARKPGHSTLTLLLTALVALGSVPLAHADRGRDDDHNRYNQRDRRDVRPYSAGHWVLDSRFRHNHYYPARGYAVSVLPPGYLDVLYNRGHLFFSAGVWFRPVGNRYVVVAPPPGAYIPVLPPGYTTVWVGNAPYYYANDVYYTEAPSGGYVVAAPPADSQVVMQPPPPVAAPTPYSPPPVAAPAPYSPAGGDNLIVYPKNGQSATQTAADRAECTRWAINQTGFDPASVSPGDPRMSDFQRAAGACLEAHGYTVR